MNALEKYLGAGNNMKVLIDTNVAITYISGRNDTYSKEIAEILRLCATEEIDGLIAIQTLSNIWYICREVPVDERRNWLKQLCTILEVAGTETKEVLRAIEDVDFKDFEDALALKFIFTPSSKLISNSSAVIL